MGTPLGQQSRLPETKRLGDWLGGGKSRARNRRLHRKHSLEFRIQGPGNDRQLRSLSNHEYHSPGLRGFPAKALFELQDARVNYGHHREHLYFQNSRRVTNTSRPGWGLGSGSFLDYESSWLSGQSVEQERMAEAAFLSRLGRSVAKRQIYQARFMGRAKSPRGSDLLQL